MAQLLLVLAKPLLFSSCGYYSHTIHEHPTSSVICQHPELLLPTHSMQLANMLAYEHGSQHLGVSARAGTQTTNTKRLM